MHYTNIVLALLLQLLPSPLQATPIAATSLAGIQARQDPISAISRLPSCPPAPDGTTNVTVPIRAGVRVSTILPSLILHYFSTTKTPTQTYFSSALRRLGSLSPYPLHRHLHLKRSPHLARRDSDLQTHQRGPDVGDLCAPGLRCQDHLQLS